MDSSKVRLIDKGDLNGFFGLFTNNLSNILVMAGLLSVSIGMPSWLVYGKILPAVGLSILVSGLYYTYMAYKLAVKEGRNDVTSLPSGTSVPHMFLICFLIMGPVYWETKDPVLAWSAGLSWCFVEGIIEVSGALIGPKLRRIIPRAAMLSALAGVSITFIAMTPAMQTFRFGYIGFVSLAVILLGWFGKIRMPFNIPVGLVAIILGTVIGWGSGMMDLDALVTSLKSVQPTYAELSVTYILKGFTYAAPYLAAAIPLGVYNFFETMDNVESAHIAGDSYNTTETMVADGVTSLIGCSFGSPFPTAVFIGHPGWKGAGAKLGYTLLSGIAIFIITWFNGIYILSNLIPLTAIVPILLYIGLIIGSQAFNAVDGKYAQAVVLGLIPWLANWGQNITDIALGQSGSSAQKIGYEVLAKAGLEYGGMASLGSGAIIVSMIWASICIFIIDHQLDKAALTALIGAVLSFIGLIHTTTIGFGQANSITFGYLFIALIFFLSKKNTQSNQIE